MTKYTCLFFLIINKKSFLQPKFGINLHVYKYTINENVTDGDTEVFYSRSQYATPHEIKRSSCISKS